ncbi:MAG TPA: phosphoribosylanthranilate isomerase [Trueperaceae bacterium]|nr:phosphoribosylanthranilate isomerase [Trueperaceae bacterium]
MERRARVKICGITRPEDAVAAERAGADAIGVIFAASSRRRVGPVAAGAIVAAVGPMVTTVGVFVDAPLDQVLGLARRLRLGAVQLHGDEPAAYAAAVRGEVKVVRALAFERGLTPESLAGYPADAFLLDARDPGSGQPFDWAQARAWRDHPRLILAGGLTPETVGDGVEALRPYAVDVASGVESAVGEKDPDRMRAFVEAARGA